MACATIVNPDRRPVGAEQPLGPETDDLQSRREVQRRAEGEREFVRAAHVDRRCSSSFCRSRESSRVVMKASAISRTSTLGISGAGGLVEPDGQQTRHARRRCPSGSSSAPAVPSRRREVRHLADGISDEHRHAASERVGYERLPQLQPASRGRCAARRARSRTSPGGRRRAGCARTAGRRIRRSARARVGAAAAGGRPGSSSRATSEMRGGAAIALGSAARPPRANPSVGRVSRRVRVSRGMDPSGGAGPVEL